MYVFQILFATIAGHGLISLAILKLFWLRFGPHFYMEQGHFHHIAPYWADGLMILGIFFCGIAIVSFHRIFLFSVLATVLVGTEYLLLHDCEHQAWQLAVPIGLMTTLILLTLSEISLQRQLRGENRDFEQRSAFLD